MTARLRVSHVIVRPVLLWDDGEDLTPGPETHAMVVTLAGLAGAERTIREAIAEFEQKAAQAPKTAE